MTLNISEQYVDVLLLWLEAQHALASPPAEYSESEVATWFTDVNSRMSLFETTVSNLCSAEQELIAGLDFFAMFRGRTRNTVEAV
jgi:hypothetical protein